jgi:hypothetical protein
MATEKEGGVGQRRAINERGRCFSRFANTARLLLTMVAWLKRRNTEKIIVVGKAAK